MSVSVTGRCLPVPHLHAQDCVCASITWLSGRATRAAARVLRAYFDVRAGALYQSTNHPGFSSYFLSLSDGGTRLGSHDVPGTRRRGGPPRDGYHTSRSGWDHARRWTASPRDGGRRGPGRERAARDGAMGTTRRSFAIRTAISSRSLSRACKESNRRRVMPDGAECRTARNARRRGMPDGAKRRYGPAPFGIRRCSACGAVALRVNGLRDPAPGR